MHVLPSYFHDMGYFVCEQVVIALSSACPRTSARIDHISVVVTCVKVSRGVPTTVFVGMQDGEQVRVGTKGAIGLFGITPYITEVLTGPGDRRTYVTVKIEGQVIVIKNAG